MTLLWQEPATAVYARVQQQRLSEEIARAERSAPPAAARPPARPRAGPRGRLRSPATPSGGWRSPPSAWRRSSSRARTRRELRSGPGHYPGTALPGAGTTVAIAGHRTTYGAPFRRLDDLERGDAITLRDALRPRRYRVERTRIVAPDATWVVRAGATTSSSSSPPAIRCTRRRSGSSCSRADSRHERLESRPDGRGSCSRRCTSCDADHPPIRAAGRAPEPAREGRFGRAPGRRTARGRPEHPRPSATTGRSGSTRSATRSIPRPSPRDPRPPGRRPRPSARFPRR